MPYLCAALHNKSRNFNLKLNAGEGEKRGEVCKKVWSVQESGWVISSQILHGPSLNWPQVVGPVCGTRAQPLYKYTLDRGPHRPLCGARA